MSVARCHHVAAEETRMTADPPSSPALRASDADRDRVTELLRAAVADGRLDQAEFNERLDAALTARTIDALAPLTADLIAAPGREGALVLPRAGTPAEPAAELVTISGKHGSVRRDGRWTLPHRLALRTAWCDVMLDLTSAVRSGPELVIELQVRGGDVELVLAPGMVVDANELSVRHTSLAISRDAGDNTPETLCVRLVGQMKHGRIDTRWLAPRREGALAGAGGGRSVAVQDLGAILVPGRRGPFSRACALLRRQVPRGFPVFSYRGGRCGPAVTGGVQPMLPAAGLPIRLRPGLSRRRSAACAAARSGPPAGR
jgi:hypothetical protein